MNHQPQLHAHLTGQLAGLNMPPGRPALLHASLRRTGLGRDGAALISAVLLRHMQAHQSALLVPSFTYECEDPAAWPAPPAPAEQLAALQASRQAYDPATTPVDRELGYLPEHIRQMPGAYRSTHPVLSLAAIGPRAAEATAGQPLHLPLGPESPLGWLYARDGVVMMAGTGLKTMTVIHLAETLAPVSAVRATRRRVKSAQGWVWYWGAPACGEGFPVAGDILEGATIGVGLLGSAPTRVVAVRPFVDGVVRRLRLDPGWLLCQDPACPFCALARRYLDGDIDSIISGDEAAGDYSPATTCGPSWRTARG